jgi:CheY-like chemotaxis protein
MDLKQQNIYATKMKLKIPIIAITADVTTVDLAKCKAVGMDDYITKPLDERILYSKILSLVKKTVQEELPPTDKHAKPGDGRFTVNCMHHRCF